MSISFLVFKRHGLAKSVQKYGFSVLAKIAQLIFFFPENAQL